MSNTSIVVDNVTKSFTLATNRTFKRLVVNAVKRKQLTKTFTALHDIASPSTRATRSPDGAQPPGKAHCSLISGVMSPTRARCWRVAA
jgi:hypothetical protein